jgi:hypothetical protein
MPDGSCGGSWEGVLEGLDPPPQYLKTPPGESGLPTQYLKTVPGRGVWTPPSCGSGTPQFRTFLHRLVRTLSRLLSRPLPTFVDVQTLKTLQTRIGQLSTPTVDSAPAS